MEAKDRLRTARLFLDKMKENVEDPFAFESYLFAFIESARTVTWLLQREFSKVPRFKEWYDEMRKLMECNEVCQFFKDKRTLVVHKRGPDVTRRTAHHFAITQRITETIKVEVRDQEGKLKSVGRSPPSPRHDLPPPVYTKRTWWSFAERPDEDVIDLCKQYVDKLEMILKSFPGSFRQSED